MKYRVMKFMSVVLSSSLMMGTAALAETSESETVYVFADAQGTAEKVIVSSPAEGSYAQEEINQELPVQVAVSYMLDGSAVSPDELAGKSGKVAIRFDYTNTQYETVEINGEEEKIYVPFVMVTGLMLDNDCFSNIEVSGGKIFNDGDRTFIVGLALPGMQESLGIAPEELELSDYLEITADTEDFELGMTVTLAVNGAFTGEDREFLQLPEELSESLEQLTEGSDTVNSGAAALCSGVGELQDGAGALYDGLNTLQSNNESLNQGALQVFETLLSSAQSQLAAAGAAVPELTVSNYTEVLNGVIVTLDRTGIYSQVLEAVNAKAEEQRSYIEEQVTAAIRQQAASEEQMESEEIQALIAKNTQIQLQKAIAENMASEEVQSMLSAVPESAAAVIALKTSLDSYNTFYLGLQSYTAGVADAAAGAEQLRGGIDTLKEGADELSAGMTSLNDGIQELVSAAEEELGGFAERIQAVMDTGSEYRFFTGAKEGAGDNVKFIYKTDGIEK